LALAACGQDIAPGTLNSAAAPTITSDKDDYAPGELVTLTGTNWQSGESVEIIVDDDGLDVENPWQRTVTVTADESGNFTDQFNLPAKFVADYVVKATGETSGVATTAFTDAISAEATVTPQTSYRGATVEYTLTVKNVSTLGETIGSLVISKPGGAYNNPTACTTALSGWTGAVVSGKCTFTSRDGANDNIPVNTSAQFRVTISTTPGGDDVNKESWPITVYPADDATKSSAAAVAPQAQPMALRANAFAYEITNAVVATTAATIGSTCPSPNKTAPVGSSRLIVICGSNHNTNTQSVSTTGSTLQNSTFIASAGNLSSGDVAGGRQNVVLANWPVSVKATADSSLTISAKIQSSSNSSPVTVFTGYAATAAAPVITNPTFTSVTPSSLPQGTSNQSLTIVGSGFQNGATVRFSGSDVTVNSTNFVSATQLTANVSISSTAATGAKNITVTNPDGGSVTTNNVFTVNAADNPAPTLTSINPNTKTAGDNAFTLTVNGTNFVSGSVVRVGGTARTTTYVNTTQFDCLDPRG
jgi:hypothetical protein